MQHNILQDLQSILNAYYYPCADLKPKTIFLINITNKYFTIWHFHILMHNPTCPNSNQEVMQICVNKKCEHLPYYCYAANCHCQQNHQRCTKYSFKFIMTQVNKKMEEGRLAFKDHTQRINDLYERVVRYAEDGKKKYYIWRNNLGLSQNQSQFYQLIKQRRFGELKGKLVGKVLQQLNMQTVYKMDPIEKFSQKLKNMEKIIERFLNELREVYEQNKTQKREAKEQIIQNKIEKPEVRKQMSLLSLMADCEKYIKDFDRCAEANKEILQKSEKILSQRIEKTLENSKNQIEKLKIGLEKRTKDTEKTVSQLIQNLQRKSINLEKKVIQTTESYCNNNLKRMEELEKEYTVKANKISQTLKSNMLLELNNNTKVLLKQQLKQLKQTAETVSHEIEIPKTIQKTKQKLRQTAFQIIKKLEDYNKNDFEKSKIIQMELTKEKYRLLNKELEKIQKNEQQMFLYYDNQLQSLKPQRYNKEDQYRQTQKEYVTHLNQVSDQFEKTKLKYDSQLKQFNVLKRLFGDKKIKSLQLLYRASVNKFSTRKFHQQCDDKGPTLVLIKTQFDKIIGGYTPLNWKSEDLRRRSLTLLNQQMEEESFSRLSIIQAAKIQEESKYKQSKNKESFIFSISANQRLNIAAKSQFEIKCDSSFGPIFGQGPDLLVTDKSNSGDNICRVGHTYGQCKSETQQTYAEWSGQKQGYKFKIKQWEVFAIQFQ